MSNIEEISTLSINFPSTSEDLGQQIANNHQNSSQVKNLVIENCPSTASASELISQNWFRNNFPNFTIVTLKVNGEFDVQLAEKPKRHEFKQNRRVLVSYESIADESLKIIYWKCEISHDFMQLELIDQMSRELTTFVKNFLIEILMDVKTVPSLNLCTDEKKLTHLINSNNLNLLMRACSLQNSQIVNELLKYPFEINQKSLDLAQTAADIAWQMKNSEILYSLLEHNSTFPVNFNINEASDEIKIFKSISDDMKAAIVAEDEQKVFEILDNYPKLYNFYNTLNQSAVTIAISLRKFNFHKFLTENYVQMGALEPTNIIETFSHDERREIRDLNSKLAQKIAQKHVLIHRKNSFIAVDNRNLRERSGLVKKSFEILDQIEIAQILLKVTAIHEKFSTQFDFNRNCIQHMDPKDGDETTRGSCYPSGRLYVAAKELLDDRHKFSALGTLMHEICHFAMHLTFCNGANPYAIDDHVSRLYFESILTHCRHIEAGDDIVNSVYRYKEKFWPSELIVRVPHLTVNYHQDQSKLSQLEQSYEMLFTYFNTFVIEKFNEIVLKLPILFNSDEEIKYNQLTEAYKAKIHYSNVWFQGVKVKFNEIVADKNSEIFNSLTSEIIRGILVEDSLPSIDEGNENKIDFYVERDFVEIENDRYHNDVFRPETTLNELDDENDETDNSKSTNIVRNFDQMTAIANDHKIILLSDHAGAGKSTTFRNLAVKLKKKLPNHWISYIDLKQYLSIYEKFELKIKKFEDKLTEFEKTAKQYKKVEYSAKKTLKSNSSLDRFELNIAANVKNNLIIDIMLEVLDNSYEIEKKVFTHLFRTNKVVFFFDGVDEISSKFNNFFIRLINGVRKTTENQQWIATRPQYVKDLKKKFNQKAYKLLPYDDRMRIEFISNFLNSFDNKIREKLKENTENNVNNQENAENNVNNEELTETQIQTLQTTTNNHQKSNQNKTDEILSILASFTSRYNNFDSPLMLQMIAELYVNNRIIKTNANLYSIYDQLIEMKIDVLSDKGKIAAKDRDNRKAKFTVWQVHQVYALKLMYPNGSFTDHFTRMEGNINQLQLIKTWETKEKNEWTPQAILRFGLLTVENKGGKHEFPNFVHRTFAEYFVTQFLIHNIFDLDDDDEKLSKEEMLRFKFLVANRRESQFIESYLENRDARHFCDKIYNLTVTDEMKAFFNDKKIQKARLKLVKWFSTDERFLKELKDENNETIFQLYFKFFLYDLIELVDIYEKSFTRVEIKKIKGKSKKSEDNFGVFDNFGESSNTSADDVRLQATILEISLRTKEVSIKMMEVSARTSASSGRKAEASAKNQQKVIKYMEKSNRIQSKIIKYGIRGKKPIEIVKLPYPGTEWIHYTGYPIKDPENFDKFDEIENFARKTATETDEELERLKNDCKKLFKLLCFIERVEIPQTDLKDFMKHFFAQISDYSFRSTIFGNKVLKISENRKDTEVIWKDFLKIDFVKDTILSTSTNNEYVDNIEQFFKKLEAILCNDDENLKIEKKFKILFMNIFMRSCSFAKLKSLYNKKYENDTKLDLQNYFIQHAVNFIHQVSDLMIDSDLIYNFENFLREIFFLDDDNENGRNQLRTFLEMRAFREDFRGHSVFSLMAREFRNFGNEKYKKMEKVLMNLAVTAGLTEDEVKLLYF